MERNRADVWRIAAAATIGEAASALCGAVTSPDIPLTRITAAATRLSSLLVDGDVPRLPTRLLALSDPLLEGVPLSLLTWPGQSPWLAETTPNTIVLTPSGFTAQPQLPPKRIDIVTAMTEAGDDLLLPALAAAGSESHALAAVIPQVPVRVLDSYADLTLLASAGSWVHIATHCVSRPEFHAYSGLWLKAAAPGAERRLFSWLDAVDRRAADVVVLNACSLAAGEANDSSGVTSFAPALSSAGVRNVVAALWPISDTAVLTWTPAFYATRLTETLTCLAQYMPRNNACA
jgi:CHAT domain-containing protein